MSGNSDSLELENLRKIVEDYREYTKPENFRQIWEGGYYSCLAANGGDKSARLVDELYDSWVECVIREEMNKLGLDDEYCKNKNIDIYQGEWNGDFI